MRLLAISDLHLNYRENREALAKLCKLPSEHSEDWLILAGDLGEKPETLRYAFETLGPRFRQLVWVPGNHELWTYPEDATQPRGQAKYEALVSLCRDFGVLTPEDPYPIWSAGDKSYLIAPLFLLYDYSFRPDEVSLEGALEWAMEHDILCTDEKYLHPDPYPSRAAWCHARCAWTQARLEQVDPSVPLILINHFPLRRDLVNLPRIPRFSLWCGTRLTEDWHRRFNVSAVVSGHLHFRSTEWRDGVRFEEVSLGYPRHWNQQRSLDSYFREIF